MDYHHSTVEPNCEVKTKYTGRSDRVKSVDLHPTEPLILCALYSGKLTIWNYETQTLVKNFDCASSPTRSSKFIARKNWIVAGSDDGHIRVFAIHTQESLADWEAHSDYIRSLALHPTKSFLLSSSDDLTIKLWDWDSAWGLVRKFEGHSHYIMGVLFNPRDSNQFASCSLDRTIKIWNLGSTQPQYTLDGHEKGVCSVDFSMTADKPYLISGGDDHQIKIWDYQNKICLHSLRGHSNNVTSVAFHGSLQLILSASEDETIKIWSANSFKLVQTVHAKLERIWSLSVLPGTAWVGLAADLGSSLLQIGRDFPLITMDYSGKVVWIAKGNNAKVAFIASNQDDLKDTLEVHHLSPVEKDFGQCEIYPSSLEYCPDGRFISTVGDGEFIIYTSIAWRNKCFGRCTGFAWSPDSTRFATLSPSGSITLWKQFTAGKTISLAPYSAICSGPLLGAFSGRNINNPFLDLFEWESGILVRRLCVDAQKVVWNEFGTALAVVTPEDGFFVLSYSPEITAAYLDQGIDVPEDGISEAFSVIWESSEQISSAIWANQGFFCVIAATNKLVICIPALGVGPISLLHLPSSMAMLRYLPKFERIYLSDKNCNLYAFHLNPIVLDLISLVVLGDKAGARLLYDSVPFLLRPVLSSILEASDWVDDALIFCDEPAKRFHLALCSDQKELALQIAKEANSPILWQRLKVFALERWDPELALYATDHSEEPGDSFLLHLTTGTGNLFGGDAKKVPALERFLFAIASGDIKGAFEILIQGAHYPEAALFARTWMDSKAIEIAVSYWKRQIREQNTSWSDFSETLLSEGPQFSFLPSHSEIESGYSPLIPAQAERPTLSGSFTSGSDSCTEMMSGLKRLSLDQFDEPSAIFDQEPTIDVSQEESPDILYSFSMEEGFPHSEEHLRKHVEPEGTRQITKQSETTGVSVRSQDETLSSISSPGEVVGSIYSSEGSANEEDWDFDPNSNIDYMDKKKKSVSWSNDIPNLSFSNDSFVDTYLQSPSTDSDNFGATEYLPSYVNEIGGHTKSIADITDFDDFDADDWNSNVVIAY